MEIYLSLSLHLASKFESFQIWKQPKRVANVIVSPLTTLAYPLDLG